MKTWPSNATHVRQCIDGVAVVVQKKNFHTIDPEKPFVFGTWAARIFTPVVPIVEKPVEVVAPVVVTAQGVAAAPARPVIPWSGRRKFIAELILDGQLTAREIAARVVNEFAADGVTFDKALAHVRSTPQHLWQTLRIRATYRKEGRTQNVQVIVPTAVERIQ